MNGDAIIESLELVAERCGDPTKAVYGRLFADRPELAELFLIDDGDLAKGAMLAQVIDCVLDYVGKGAYAANLIRAELVNHESLGVEPDVFPVFFGTVRDTFRELMGGDWRDTHEAAWNELVGDLEAIVEAERTAA